MRERVFAGFFLCSLFIVVGGDAQSPDKAEKPVWTLEVIKVTPENFDPAMRYLNDHWMRVRSEAKRRGAVLDYHLISNGGMVTPGHKVWDRDSIVLLTKYKDVGAYLESRSDLMRDAGSGALRFLVSGTQGFVPYGAVKRSAEDPLNTQVFIEEPDTSTELPTKQ